MKRCRKTEKNSSYMKNMSKGDSTHSLPANMVKAFLVGGLICVSGQAVTEWALAAGMDEKTAGTWCSIALIFLSALTTGMNLYPRLAKWGGAGTLVPITGFANSVAAPAVEYQKEGQVFGIGSKIFTIADTGDTLWGADLMGVGTDTVRGRKVVADGDRGNRVFGWKSRSMWKAGHRLLEKKRGKVHWLLSLMKLRRMISWDR